MPTARRPQPRPGAERRPAVLTVAGSDNSCGAGLQADLKAIAANGCYGLAAATAVVAEIPGRVEAVEPVPLPLVERQIRLCLEAFPIRAAKTGMLFSAAVVRAVARLLQDAGVPVVVDPVMVASSGDPLIRASAVEAYRSHLFPVAALITPNTEELALLTGCRAASHRTLLAAGQGLAAETGTPVLLKGGHLASRRATDFLVTLDSVEEFTADFIHGVETHGTGCTYSAAIAANLANGLPLNQAVAKAKTYITAAIRQSLRWTGTPTRALEHFPEGPL